MFKKEVDDTIYELPDPPKLELTDGFLNLLGVEAHVILEQKFTNKKNQEDAVLKKSGKTIILMRLKTLLIRQLFLASYIFSMLAKIVISIKQLNFYG